MIPKKKQNKKEQKRLNTRQRKTWGFSPVTRVKKSKKKYNRKNLPETEDFFYVK